MDQAFLRALFVGPFFFAAGFGAAFLAALFVLGAAAFAAGFFFSAFHPIDEDPSMGTPALDADFAGVALLRAARVLAARAAFSSSSNSAGESGRADLRRRSMS